MADGGSRASSVSGADNPTKQARSLQEALIGKIPESDAMDNLVEVEMNLDYAAENILSQDKYQNVRFPTQEEVLNDLHSKFENKSETRLFSCKDCDRYWWRRVPSRKTVSKCRRCCTRYEAIPRHQEWGWCKYSCQNCGHEFSGFGSMGSPAGSPCYKCGNQCLPVEVMPSNRRKRGNQTQNTHRCDGHNCYRRCGEGFGRGIGGVIGASRGRGGGFGVNLLVVGGHGDCPHPKSRAKKVLVASDKHNSTGSTVNTFLSQGSLEEFSPDLDDIIE